MKTRKAFPILGLCLFCSTAVIADQTIPGNLIVQQDSWLYGVTTFGHLAENLQLPGLWLSVNQDEWTTTQTNVTTPGYWGTNTVVVEDWGNVDNGYWTPTYGTVTVPDYYPAVYDSEGNLVSEGYWSSHEEWQQTGQYWNSSPMWAVTGTHTESQPTWVPDVVENVEVENYGSPHVKFNASRSDTNYDFIYPSATGGSGLYTAMSIYGGGLSMTSEDTSHNVALTPWSLQHTGRGTDGTDLVAQNTMEETLHSAWRSSAEAGGGTAVVQSISHVRADALQLTRSEYGSNGSSITSQTQIAARSAQFGGAVTVEGNLNVKGVLRVLPAGDLEMAFHKGTKPDGTIDSGN